MPLFQNLFRKKTANQATAEDSHQVGANVLFDLTTNNDGGVDIVFVHGLRGSPLRTWSKNGVCWPRDLLKTDIENIPLEARSITWGYDANIVNVFTYTSQESIFGHAETLLADLSRLRIGKTRPIIFVGHSLGGLVIKETLIKSAAYQSHGRHPTLGEIYTHTRGVIFLGTPHRGSNKEGLGNVIARVAKYSFRQPNEQLLRTLQHDSHILESQRDQFTTISKDIPVVCIREEIPTGVGMIVPEASASYDGFSVMRDSINANHMDIAKFEHRQDIGYQRVFGHIIRLIHEVGSSKKDEVGQHILHQLQPSSTVPFSRDTMFVGREDIMVAIETLDQPRRKQFHRRMALVGLGGVGKSQIAIEYTYRVRESASNTWAFWIHASNVTRFEQGYREIASIAEIPDRDNPKTDTLQLVKKWLCNEKNGHWLMVLDNADDNNVFFKASTGNAPLVDYLPQTSNGSILITSRNKMVAQNLVGSYGNAILVEPMSTDNALTLLRTRIYVGQSSENEARALVNALECIPLAITQAGAYIANRAPRITVLTYLERFRQGESNQEHLLKYDDFKDLRRDESIRHPVITTWQISFNQICYTSSAATDLLALMSMFDRQGIPEYLINQDMDQLDFEDAIAPLISFSLVRAEIGGQSFEMHRLVQLSIRQWLKLQGQFQKWVQQSQQVIEKALPSGDEIWTTSQILLPHVKEVMQFTEEFDKEIQLNETRIANRCGWYLFLAGKYEEAEAMHRRAFTTREKVLGAEHPNTLTSVNNLGSVLERLGRYEEAEAMHRRALITREKVLGAENPNTLVSVNDLGLVLDCQGKYEEAETMHRRALTGYQKVLGAEHPNTLTSVSNLGLVLECQGKYEEAETMHRRALNTREKVLGAEHPNTIFGVNCLGSVLECQGKYEEAETMYRRALTAREKMLGAEHPDTLVSASNLGSVLECRGKYEEAEAMHRRALQGSEKVLGAEHPDTIVSVNYLGSVLECQGKYEEAETMHRRALTTREKVLGAEHPDTLVSVNYLGSVLECQGKYEEAKTMHRQTLTTRESVLGAEHPDTLFSVSNLGSVLECQGKYEEAEAMYRRALITRERVLGAEHPDTLVSVNCLGSVLECQGKYEEAEAMHRRALTIREKVLGAEHPNMLVSVNYLGSVLECRGKYEEAEIMHRQTLATREKVLGAKHPDTLFSVSNLGSVLECQGKYEEAEAMHRRALTTREKVLGAEHPDTLVSVNNLGSVLKSQNKYEEAEAMHRRALQGSEKVLGAEHPNTMVSIDNLGLVLKSQGKYEEAEAMHRRALTTREKVLGAKHPDTLVSVSNLGSVLECRGKYEEAKAIHRRC